MSNNSFYLLIPSKAIRNQAEHAFVVELEAIYNNDVHFRDRMSHHLPSGPAVRTLLATIARWFGSPTGARFLADAEESSDSHSGDSRVFLDKWVVRNARAGSMNSRLLEVLLESDRDTISSSRSPSDLTLSQYETADDFMLWLGTSDGARYLSNARARIAAIPQETEATYIC